AETLAHHALLDPAPFEGQGLARAHAELLFASLFSRFSHSNPNSRVSRRVSIMFLRRPPPRPRCGRDLAHHATPPPALPHNSQCAGGAPETSRFRDRRAGLHVSHLTVPMPNPIALR